MCVAESITRFALISVHEPGPCQHALSLGSAESAAETPFAISDSAASLLEGSDVRHQLIDLLSAQALSERRHLELAF
jgi:hypothetical protein